MSLRPGFSTAHDINEEEPALCSKQMHLLTRVKMTQEREAGLPHGVS